MDYMLVTNPAVLWPTDINLLQKLSILTLYPGYMLLTSFASLSTFTAPFGALVGIAAANTFFFVRQSTKKNRILRFLVVNIVGWVIGSTLGGLAFFILSKDYGNKFGELSYFLLPSLGSLILFLAAGLFSLRFISIYNHSQ